jgi:hypothetical protein
MSKVIVALGSVCVSVFLFGSQTSIFAQPSSPSPGGSSIIDMGSVPPVPSLPKILQQGIEMRNGLQKLDGLNCEGCTFENVTFVYGGGPFRLEKCHFGGTIRFVLQGAAANVVAVTKLAEDVAASMAPSGPSPRPKTKEYKIATPITADWISPPGNP